MTGGVERPCHGPAGCGGLRSIHRRTGRTAAEGIDLGAHGRIEGAAEEWRCGRCGRRTWEPLGEWAWAEEAV